MHGLKNLIRMPLAEEETQDILEKARKEHTLMVITILGKQLRGFRIKKHSPDIELRTTNSESQKALEDLLAHGDTIEIDFSLNYIPDSVLAFVNRGRLRESAKYGIQTAVLAAEPPILRAKKPETIFIMTQRAFERYAPVYNLFVNLSFDPNDPLSNLFNSVGVDDERILREIHSLVTQKDKDIARLMGLSLTTKGMEWACYEHNALTKGAIMHNEEKKRLAEGLLAALSGKITEKPAAGTYDGIYAILLPLPEGHVLGFIDAAKKEKYLERYILAVYELIKLKTKSKGRMAEIKSSKALDITPQGVRLKIDRAHFREMHPDLQLSLEFAINYFDGRQRTRHLRIKGIVVRTDESDSTIGIRFYNLEPRDFLALHTYWKGLEEYYQKRFSR